LISNSIKYTPTGGEIHIHSSEVKTGWVRFEITDTGIGIPPDDLTNVFNEFYRAKNAKEIVRDEKSSGLGLAIVREIVENHSGKIRIESKLNLGTKVVIDLPQEKKAGFTDHKT
jgi:signal transduction histidine kinase